MDAPEVVVARVTETEFVKVVPLGVIRGVATVETATGADTVNVKAVLLLIPPPIALTVTGKFPVGVDPVVLILSIVEQAGVQEVEENEPVAPVGRPVTLNETGCAVALVKDVLMASVVEDPAIIDLLPELEIA